MDVISTVLAGVSNRLASERLGLPIAIINIGETRADKILEANVDIKINAKCTGIMKQFC